MEFLAKENKTKRMHESASSALACPPKVNLVAQRSEDLSENDDDDERLVRVALQKRKIVALDALALEKAKKAQPVAEPRAFVLLSAIMQ